jgi:hypothetical protein
MPYKLFTKLSIVLQLEWITVIFHLLYNTRSRNVIAASGADLNLEEINIHFFDNK